MRCLPPTRHDPRRQPTVARRRSARTAAAGPARSRSRRGVLLAADAAAVRARPHQPVADAQSATATRSSTAATATRRRARMWERHFATTLRTRPLRAIVATHCHPDHLGNGARGSPARFGCADRDDAGRVPDRARASSTSARGYVARRHARTVRAPRHGGDEHSTRSPRAAIHYRRGVARGRRTSFRRMIDGDTVRCRRPRAWRVIRRLRPFAGARGARTQPTRGVLISGDMLLPRISTNVAVWPGGARRRSARALPRFARRVRDAAAAKRWCCRRTACRFAASPPASRSLRAHHAARLAELRRRSSRAAAAVGSAYDHAAGAVPPRARPAAALLRDGRGDRPPESPVARRPRYAHAVAADGAIRFAT